MFQRKADAVFAGTFCYIGHLVKSVAGGRCPWRHSFVKAVSMEGRCCCRRRHRRPFVYPVIIKHIVKTGGFGVAERNEFAEIAAPVNALKIAVTCGTETGKLLGVLKP